MGALADTSRLGKFVRLLGSDCDGEVIAAARALVRTLSAQGCDLHDLVKHMEAGARVIYRDRVVYRDPPARPASGFTPNATSTTYWAALARQCRDNDRGRLSPWEREFIRSVLGQIAHGGEPSEKQQAVINRLANKLAGAGS